MSGIIHMVNQTPIQWFCKKQNVVETATYGSEFMVARQATEQIMDLRYTLRMMGIPIDGPSWMFGDNQSVITSSTIPHSNLNKRHNALSYHRVREAIASVILYFMHIDGKLNPSDVLTKFLPWAKFWPLIQPLLFWKGETIKNIHPNLPITQAIEAIALATSSGLRGVSSQDQVSPSEVHIGTTARSSTHGGISILKVPSRQFKVIDPLPKFEPIKFITWEDMSAQRCVNLTKSETPISDLKSGDAPNGDVLKSWNKICSKNSIDGKYVSLEKVTELLRNVSEPSETDSSVIQIQMPPKLTESVTRLNPTKAVGFNRKPPSDPMVIRGGETT
jgi:hypothetical protein